MSRPTFTDKRCAMTGSLQTIRRARILKRGVHPHGIINEIRITNGLCEVPTKRHAEQNAALVHSAASLRIASNKCRFDGGRPADKDKSGVASPVRCMV